MTGPTADSDLSITEYRKGCVAFAEVVTRHALFHWAMAVEARDDYAAHPQWVEQLERTAALYRMAAERANRLYGDVWTRNRKIFDRIYHPRGGSLAKEARADNLAAIKDHETWNK